MTPLHIIGGLVAVGLISRRPKKHPRVYTFSVGKVLKEDKGISVSVNPVPGFEMGELVATGEVPSAPRKVAELLWDMSDYPAWMPRVKTVETISSSPTKRTDYFVFEAPGGNRDIFSEAVRNDSDTKITIKFKQKEGAEKAGLTRLTLRQGVWELTPSSSGGTSIKYKLRADPGVDMSTKMLQNMAAKGIMSLFEAIKSQV